MEDDIRSPFKKRYEYKEHSSYSFQLNDVLIIQSIFAFVCRSRQSGVGRHSPAQSLYLTWDECAEVISTNLE